MSESVGASIETPVGGAEAEETIRVPRNIMGLIRQSYDTREKVLDWLLAIAVVSMLVWIFRDQIKACFISPLPDVADSPNAGRDDNWQPNQDVAGAFPPQRAQANVYTYNLPPSRNVRYGIGPSATRPPDNPSDAPAFPTMTDC